MVQDHVAPSALRQRFRRLPGACPRLSHSHLWCSQPAWLEPLVLTSVLFNICLLLKWPALIPSASNRLSVRCQTASEAERAILGGIILDNGLISQAIELLRPEDFLRAFSSPHLHGDDRNL